MEISLPEQVRMQFRPAGFGSRALAYITDFVIRWSGLGIIGFLLLWIYFKTLKEGEILRIVFHKIFDFADGTVDGKAPELSNLWIFVIISFFVFAVEWGYNVYFETRRQGVTPGKKLLGLRVVDELGLPITFRASILRNLLLIVDLLPAIGLVGLLSMMINKKHQRIGDIVAGTIVVYETTTSEIDYDLDRAESPALILPLKQYNLLETYMKRRSQLTADKRTSMQQMLVNLLAKECEGQGVNNPESISTEDSWLDWVFKNSQPAQITYGDENETQSR